MSATQEAAFGATVDQIVVWNTRKSPHGLGEGGHVMLNPVPPHLQVPAEEPGDPPPLHARRRAYAAMMVGAISGCPLLKAGRNVVPADYWAWMEEKPGIRMMLQARELVVAGLATGTDLTAQEERVAREGIAKLEAEIAALKARLPPGAAAPPATNGGA